MTDSNRRHHVKPETLARARELRTTMTSYERKLWQHLRRKQLCGLKFRRQHPVGRFVVDFYCHTHKLAIELDGATHDASSQRHYDEKRTAWLARQGIRVIRFSNQEVDRNLEGVLTEIAQCCGLAMDS
jgi:very-short-patch-repair endonuclease